MTTQTLLNQVLELGQQLKAALEEHDMDRFDALVQERQGMIETLTSSHQNREETGIQARIDQLNKQFEEVLSLLLKKEDAMREALLGLERYKEARRNYGQRPTRAILNPHLAG